MIILLAGADFPPPPGFILVIVFDLASSLVIYLRMNSYFNWVNHRTEHRLLKVLLDGISAGVVVGLLLILLSSPMEPGIPHATWLDYLIWFLVLSMVGAANSMLIYGMTGLFLRVTQNQRKKVSPENL